MLSRFRYILLFCTALFIGFRADAQLAMPDNVCIGAIKHYYVDSDSLPGSTYIWRVDGITQSASIANEIDISWNTIGIYLLDVQELAADGCSGPLRSGQVFVSSAPTIIANSNSPVCMGNSINLTTETIPEGNYLWMGPNGYTSTLQNSVILFASSVNAGIYSLVVSANGCISDTSTFTIIISDCDIVDFNIPEGFSPNGDGINDLFVIRGIDHYPNNSIIIFNRWGDKVFEASPYQNTWDGKCTMGVRAGGDQLPIGTYFYLLNLGDGSEILKGTIYLNK
jgi:gliding motility-associated-like protein